VERRAVDAVFASMVRGRHVADRHHGRLGLLGSNLAVELLRQGHAVRATRRANTRVEHLKEFPIEWCDADLGDPGAGSRCCTPFCDLSAPNTCPLPEQMCAPWSAAPDPGYENVGVCLVP